MLVLRLTRRADIKRAQGSVHLSRLLRPLGVPLPELLYHDLTCAQHRCPFTILERLPGCDLGDVIACLSGPQLKQIAERLYRIQSAVSVLPEGAGYGFTADPGSAPARNWRDVLTDQIGRAKDRIAFAGVVDVRVADPIVEAISKRTELDEISPTPFLHDITTKNVLIHAGNFSGIVDVDDLCYGDPLFLTALIRMALMAHQQPMTYYDHWIDLLSPDPAARQRIDLYTAIFSVIFLSELGQQFNRARVEPVDQSFSQHLRALCTALTAKL